MGADEESAVETSGHTVDGIGGQGGELVREE